MCDSCPKTYHKSCLINPNGVNHSEWYCEACRGLTKLKLCNICNLEINTPNQEVECSICDDKLHLDCIGIP